MSETNVWDLKAGDTIFREGDPWDGLYLLKAGHIEIFRERADQVIRLAVMGPGEILGTVTILSREPRSASARALTDITIQHFDPQFVHQNFGATNPGIAAIIKDILARLKHVNQQLTEIQVDAGGLPPNWLVCMRHLRQLVSLLIAVVPGSLIGHEGRQLYRLDGFYNMAEAVLRLKAEYVGQLLGTLLKSSTLSAADFPEHGPCIVNPSLSRLQAFLEYSNHPERLEIQKYGEELTAALPALKLLAELMSVPGFGDVIAVSKLAPLFLKLYPDVPGEEVIHQLVELRFLDLLESEKVRLYCPEILRATTFNHILIALHTLTPNRLA
jgi:hypothetical protein